MTHYQYVPARTSHILHLILTCMTLGLWSPVWFLVWLHNHNRMVTKALPMQMGVDYGYTTGTGGLPRPSFPQGPALMRGEVSRYGQQHQVPPRLPRAEAQGVQHEEGRYH
jgi:hypothetical protein